MLKQAAFLPFLLLVATSPLAKGATWGYGDSNGPANWASVVANTSCAGTSQSPIDIDSSSATQQDYAAFSFTGYDAVPSDATMTLKNNGHSVLVELSSASKGISVSGGGLSGSYIAAQYHFHWGSQADTTVGSEHTINGKSYPGELHIVHYSSGYATIGDAVASGNSSALAVLGFFLEVDTAAADNAALAPIIDNIMRVNDSGDAYQYPASDEFTIDSLLPSSKTNFYRYSGSLTTPGCDEIVVWTVFEETIKISQSQLTTLVSSNYFTAESGQAATVMANNYRPVQALSGRTVNSSFASASLRILPAWQLLVALATCALAPTFKQ